MLPPRVRKHLAEWKIVCLVSMYKWVRVCLSRKCFCCFSCENEMSPCICRSGLCHCVTRGDTLFHTERYNRLSNIGLFDASGNSAVEALVVCQEIFISALFFLALERENGGKWSKCKIVVMRNIVVNCKAHLSCALWTIGLRTQFFGYLLFLSIRRGPRTWKRRLRRSCKEGNSISMRSACFHLMKMYHHYSPKPPNSSHHLRMWHPIRLMCLRNLPGLRSYRLRKSQWRNRSHRKRLANTRIRWYCCSPIFVCCCRCCWCIGCRRRFSARGDRGSWYGNVYREAYTSWPRTTDFQSWIPWTPRRFLSPKGSTKEQRR